MPEGTGHDDDLRDARIGEILSDFADRRAAGEAESETELLAAHPDLADELRLHLDMLRNLSADQSRIDALVAQGILRRTSDPQYAAELGPYRIKRFVGQGGMGIVLQAHEASLNRAVALKILRPDLAGDRAALARFTREAQAAAALRHPNIVTVHAVGEENGVHFLVMEFVDGPSLRDRIQQTGPLPAETIATFFRQVLSALARAHEAGLIHRDIKSSNILVDRANRAVKIADFGLARMQASGTRMTTTGSILGTPEYMSPEQARGTGRVDHRTDLYSAGVVLYEMLTGRTPFKADTPSAVIHQILHDDPPDPRRLTADASPHLASLALRLLAKRPEDRFDSAGDALAALDTGERVLSVERRRRFRRRTLCAVLAIGALSLGCWAVWQAALRQPPITAVRVDPDVPYRIQAQYGDDMKWRRFHEFASDARLTEAAFVHTLDADSQMVFVGSNTRLDQQGNTLVALDRSRMRVTAIRIQADRWPDCDEAAEWWYVSRVFAGELDPQRGREVIVVAQDPYEYPTRISVVDPHTLSIRLTFWHFGQLGKLETDSQLAAVRLVDGFFEDGRAAILAWGQNNKLDGFGDPPPRPYGPMPGEDLPRTEWDKVGVVMILDPLTMDGYGPPHVGTGRAANLDNYGVAAPYAYAFLDWPIESRDLRAPRKPSKRPPLEGAPSGQGRGIDLVKVSERSPPPSATGPWFQVQIGGEGTLPPLIVDRNLQLVEVGPLAPVQRGMKEVTKEYWEKYWHPIVQHGQYVRD